MFQFLEEINARPEPFEFYTVAELWANEHTSKKMLAYHLSQETPAASRKLEFIERSVDWIVDRFGIGPGFRLADFGCGPGLYTIRLAARGADVTGIDFSQNSLRYAREAAEKAGLEITYITQNYLEYESDERFDLITLIYCDYCALSPKQRGRMLRKFFRHLNPGGAVLLDVHSLRTFEQQEESQSYELNQMDQFWSPQRYYAFVNSFKYEDEKVTLDKYTIVEAERTRVVYNWLQYFTPESLRAEFEAAGFEVEDIYSDVAGTPYEADAMDIAIVGRKPA